MRHLVPGNVFASGLKIPRLCSDVTGSCCPWHFMHFLLFDSLNIVNCAICLGRDKKAQL